MIRQIVQSETNPERRCLIIIIGTTDKSGRQAPVEVE
jgi:hypothetical protein